LIGVLAQRLVRTLCPNCKAPVAISKDYWDQLGVGDAIAAPASAYKAVGCLECRQTGYLGRSGAYELMQLNAALQSAVAHNPDLANLRRLAVEAGMRPLRHTAAEKIVAGMTTVEEVLSLTPDPRER
jgi:general secretion pathway protein E